MPLPKPMSQRPTGMPQMRRRSGLRTAAGNLQDAFLERVRAVRDDPLILLPSIPDGAEEPREIGAIRAGLEKVKAGRLGFFARRDKGVLGAAWACRALAEKDSAPRLMDMRVEGDRRFFWPVGHVAKPACMGVQNFDDPLALMQAYKREADAGLFFFAGPDLWCTGRSPRLLPEWVAALGERLEVDVELDGDGRGVHCAHPDRAALAHVLPAGDADRPAAAGGGPTIRLCAACCGPGTAQAIGTRLLTPGGRRLYALEVALPDGTRQPVAPEADALYRVARKTGADILSDAVAAWQKGLQGRFAIGDRLYATQDEFLDQLEAPAWMRPALAAMTKPGHAAPPMSLADLLLRHRERLSDGIGALGADPQAVAERGGNAEEGALLRIAHEQAERRAKTADLPAVRPSGSLGRWIDGFVRSRRTDGEVVALQKVRREAARLQDKAHVAAFIAAAGSDPSVGTGFSFDTKEAGLGLAPQAKRVLDATGPDYVVALREYLEQSGSGETLA